MAINIPQIILVFLGSFLCAFQLFGLSRDFETYRGAFSYYNDMSHIIWIEPSFILASLLLSEFNFGFFIYIFINTLAALAIKFFILRDLFSKKHLPVMIFYLFTFFILHEYTQFRISTALAFFYLAYFTKQKLIVKISYLLIACSFHYSIIILIFLFALSRITLTRKMLYTTLSLSVIFSILFTSLFEFLAPDIPRLVPYVEQLGSYKALFAPGKMALFAPYILYLYQKSDVNRSDFKLLHLIICLCISCSLLPEVLTTRIAGMGYFLSVIILFKLKFSTAYGSKNLIYFLVLIGGSSTFILVLL